MLEGHSDQVLAVAISPDGTAVVSASRDNYVRLWDAATGELVASGLLACDARLDTAETAVSVRSDYRAKGLGWAMLEFLSDAAQKMGASAA